MNARKDLIREYKERKKTAGVFQVKNTENGKVLIGGSLNLEGVLNGQKFRLDTGTHRNAALQAEWKSFGAAAFTLEILEEVKETDDPHFNVEDELTLLEDIWLEKLEPYGELGYNTRGTKFRQV
ncbi:MAG: GIY-YIG nuclease family protein [Bacteroidota bacterium]